MHCYMACDSFLFPTFLPSSLFSFLPFFSSFHLFICLSFPVYMVRVCLCVHVHTCCAGIATCLFSCGGQRSTLSISLFHSLPRFLRQNVSVTIEYTLLARLVSHLSSGICLHTSSAGILGVSSFDVVLGIWTQFFILQTESHLNSHSLFLDLGPQISYFKIVFICHTSLMFMMTKWTKFWFILKKYIVYNHKILIKIKASLYVSSCFIPSKNKNTISSASSPCCCMLPSTLVSSYPLLWLRLGAPSVNPAYEPNVWHSHETKSYGL